MNLEVLKRPKKIKKPTQEKTESEKVQKVIKIDKIRKVIQPNIKNPYNKFNKNPYPRTYKSGPKKDQLGKLFKVPQERDDDRRRTLADFKIWQKRLIGKGKFTKSDHINIFV